MIDQKGDYTIRDYLDEEAKKYKKYVKTENNPPIDHPMVETDLYLYEIRMEREQKYYTHASVNDNLTTELLRTDPRMLSPNSNGDDHCFGILSPVPLQNVAPFELYDIINADGYSKNSTYSLGIISVKILPIKAMIRLDKSQVITLEHFHRVVALVNGVRELKATKFYRDTYIDPDPTRFTQESDAAKQFEYSNYRTFTQRFGHLNYLFVPLSSGAASQFPWKGYDIDWALVTDMLVFERRMVKIYNAKFDDYDLKDELREKLKYHRRLINR